MILTIEQILATESPLTLSAGFNNDCPCALLLGMKFEIEVHCWRSCSRCPYAGIHVRGLAADVAQQVAEHIRDHNRWTERTEWAIVIEDEVAMVSAAAN